MGQLELHTIRIGKEYGVVVLTIFGVFPRRVENGDLLLQQEVVEGIDVISTRRAERSMMQTHSIPIEEGVCVPCSLLSNCQSDNGIRKNCALARVGYTRESKLAQHLFVERHRARHVIDREIDMVEAENVNGHTCRT